MNSTVSRPTSARCLLHSGVLLWLAVCGTEARAQALLDTRLAQIGRQHNFPALAAAVMVQGRLLAVGAAGTRRAGAAVPVTHDDRFHIGSDTKAMTALLAAMMVDEGKLTWDSTLAQVFPELQPQMDARLQQVTLTQLLSHTSGLPADDPSFVDLIIRSSLQDGNLDELRYWMLQQTATRPLAAAPGSQFAYSNLGYILAGSVIERVSGRTWEELMVERIFKPLGLKSAGLGPQATLGRVDAPLGHQAMPDGTLKAMLSGPQADNPAVMGPAGTAHMSVRDFARWGDWIAGQGRRPPQLVRPETLRKLVTPVIAMPLSAGTSATVSGAARYALGWGIITMSWAPRPLVFHGGSNTMNKAYIWLDTERDATVVTMTNVATPATEDVLMRLAGDLYTDHVQAAGAAR